MHNITNVQPTKSIEKIKISEERVKTKPKFHRTANLKPSINYDTL